MNTLLDLLAEYGGTVESTGAMDVYNINQAIASGRMWVREDGLGFVWMPPEKFPETPEEVERFEKWFPLPVELPKGLKEPNFLKRGEVEKKEEDEVKQSVFELKSMVKEYIKDPEMAKIIREAFIEFMDFPGQNGSALNSVDDEKHLEEFLKDKSSPVILTESLAGEIWDAAIMYIFDSSGAYKNKEQFIKSLNIKG